MNDLHCGSAPVEPAPARPTGLPAATSGATCPPPRDREPPRPVPRRGSNLNQFTSVRPSSSPKPWPRSLRYPFALALILIACAGCSGNGAGSQPTENPGRAPEDRKLEEVVASGKSSREIRRGVIEELKKRDASPSKTGAPASGRPKD